MFAKNAPFKIDTRKTPTSPIFVSISNHGNRKFPNHIHVTDNGKIPLLVDSYVTFIFEPLTRIRLRQNLPKLLLTSSCLELAKGGIELLTVLYLRNRKGFPLQLVFFSLLLK